MARRGFFLALEGGEGSGKSTVARLLEQRFAHNGRTVIVTREPGGSPAAESIRELLLSDAFHGAEAWCEALLFAAARADHVARTIRPALREGHLVICDRFVDSSVAYQGVARGLGESPIRRANEIAIADTVPDLVAVLDIDPVIGLARALGHNRMEAEGLAFHRQVRQAFLRFAANEPDRYLVTDAQAPAQQVADKVSAAVELRLGSRG